MRPPSSGCTWHPDFNSIKVRLKHLASSGCGSPSRFQFHKGTIKTNPRTEGQMRQRFQFHKGTIKTAKKNDSNHHTPLFQFHKGTIKTPRIYRGLPFYLYFNSIKVRLKLYLIKNSCSCCIFQFHKGTIKTRKMSFDVLTALKDFNSIKVRLKLEKSSLCYLLF